jgi:predicted kinase
VLRYYVVHRALVRAKVAALRAAQPAPAIVRRAANDAVRHYLDLAVATSRPPHPVLMITHGFSGSGKTTLTQGLLEAIGAVRLRGDIERKRLFGLAPRARGGTPLYSSEATQATYGRLFDAARTLLQAGFSVVLDATFLQRHLRDAARDVATALAVPFVILDFDVDLKTLRERVAQRQQRADDASDAGPAVLESQRVTAEPLAPDELAAVYRCPVATLCAEGVARADWSPLLQRLAADPDRD